MDRKCATYKNIYKFKTVDARLAKQLFQLVDCKNNIKKKEESFIFSKTFKSEEMYHNLARLTSIGLKSLLRDMNFLTSFGVSFSAISAELSVIWCELK